MAFDRATIGARLTLGLIATADIPRVAWDALEAGIDGPATRRLAAMDKPTWSEVEGPLPAAMREMGLAAVTRGEAALRIAKVWTEEALQTGRDPLQFSEELYHLWVRSGYAREMTGFGTLSDSREGRLDAEFREWIRRELQALLAK
jgi:hypothetical protein